ncbi:hypothetical protein [Desulfobaculum bizertense]|uniref:HD domain-containing protein n=1 Tax=Desulfobaculum bizertense DSM 18034 TaxID=1121442 RepID=A0A1T4W6S4_9BACT|nr:hypothetical protein [Desulfobaculum bizertense]SKA72748.1 hypothetical protein SAMN02745702_01684 [Desulfobaculum bizertense DSM 18034]
MNDSTLRKMKNEAKAVTAQYTLPRFYRDCSSELNFCSRSFFDHPDLLRLQGDVIPFLYDDASYGVYHAKKSAIEAGAIILHEAPENDIAHHRHLAYLAQFSGLLHGTCRLEQEHGEKGAEVALMVLKEYEISDEDRDLVAFAIRDHRPFEPRLPAPNKDAEIIANALYDAVNFRWGLDLYSTTLWEFSDYNELEFDEALALFEKSGEIIKKLDDTFRSSTGKLYGPEFLEIGTKLVTEIPAHLNEKKRDILSL